MFTSAEIEAAVREEENIIRTVGRAFWPHPYALIFAAITVLTFHLVWAVQPLMWAAGLWSAAHVVFRGAQNGAAFGELLSNLLNGASELAKRATTPATAKHAPIQAFAAFEASPSPPSPPAAHTKIDWAGGFSALIKWGPLAIALVAGLAVVLTFKGWIGGALGLLGFHRETVAEIRAEVRADIAESQTRAAEAGARQANRAAVRVDTYHSAVERIEAEGESAREEIAAAPDLESGIAAHRAYVGSLRDGDAAARAAALSDFRASINP